MTLDLLLKKQFKIPQRYQEKSSTGWKKILLSYLLKIQPHNCKRAELKMTVRLIITTIWRIQRPLNRQITFFVLLLAK